MKKTLISDDSPFLTRETRKNRWAIPYHPECLNARLDHLLVKNQEYIQGKRILDVGSHMGTFAYAALESGADFIEGIDTEENMIRLGQELFQELNIAKEKSYTGKLVGIKGQYLIFEDQKVFNIRSNEGIVVRLTIN